MTAVRIQRRVPIGDGLFRQNACIVIGRHCAVIRLDRELRETVEQPLRLLIGRSATETDGHDVGLAAFWSARRWLGGSNAGEVAFERGHQLRLSAAVECLEDERAAGDENLLRELMSRLR